MARSTGAELLCALLEAAGVEFVFGLPGTQTVPTYEALRRSRLRAIVPSHELGAAFMAAGYARVSRKVGVLLTIPGPGFAYALAGIAEAKLDGVAVLHITLQPAVGPTGEPGFQAIDQDSIGAALTKRTFTVSQRSEIESALRSAMECASSDPGPVMLHVAEHALSDSSEDGGARVPRQAAAKTNNLATFVDRLAGSLRPAIFLATDYAESLPGLAEITAAARIPVCVPATNRGTIAEDHNWCLCFDDQRTTVASLNAFLGQCDNVAVLGTRLGHVSTAGFKLKLPPEKVFVAARDGAQLLSHGYKASMTVRGNLDHLMDAMTSIAARTQSAWTEAELGEWRSRFSGDQPADPPEPRIAGVSPAEFFSELRSCLPRDAVVVTDSGLHQAMVRRHYQVLGRAGLIIPSDLQAMGFGLPAAIGAKLASPRRTVVAIIGDGSFAMCGLELLTAVREKIPLVVMVMNDGKLNLIRVQQLREYGRSHGVDLQGPDYELMAAAMGVAYRRLTGDYKSGLRESFASGLPMLIDVPVGDSPSIVLSGARSFARETIRSAIGPRLVSWLKNKLR